jgi:hypothetical protein
MRILPHPPLTAGLNRLAPIPFLRVFALDYNRRNGRSGGGTPMKSSNRIGEVLSGIVEEHSAAGLHRLREPTAKYLGCTAIKTAVRPCSSAIFSQDGECFYAPRSWNI